MAIKWFSLFFIIFVIYKYHFAKQTTFFKYENNAP